MSLSSIRTVKPLYKDPFHTDDSWGLGVILIKRLGCTPTIETMVYGDICRLSNLTANIVHSAVFSVILFVAPFPILLRLRLLELL